MADNIDKSDAADATRLRWMLNGHGFFLEEACLHGRGSDEDEQDCARAAIDKAMIADG